MRHIRIIVKIRHFCCIIIWHNKKNLRHFCFAPAVVEFQLLQSVWEVDVRIMVQLQPAVSYDEGFEARTGLFDEFENPG